MTLAHSVLDELAGIGAKIEPAGAQLILRAGPTAIPAALVRRVREAKSDLIEILSLSGGPDQATGRSLEDRIVRWLDRHPSPSPGGRCAWCGECESPSAVVLPFGAVPGTHTWLHPECWRPWSEDRRTKAITALSEVPTRS